MPEIYKQFDSITQTNYANKNRNRMLLTFISSPILANFRRFLITNQYESQIRALRKSFE